MPPVTLSVKGDGEAKKSDLPLPRNNGLLIYTPALPKSEQLETTGMEAAEKYNIAAISKEWAARLLGLERIQEALALSRYILTTRLGGEYWIEAIPTFIKSAMSAHQIDGEIDFLIEQITKPSIEAPEENSIIQSAILGGILDGLMEVRRYDLAKVVIEKVLLGNISDQLKLSIEDYAASLVYISQQ